MKTFTPFKASLIFILGLLATLVVSPSVNAGSIGQSGWQWPLGSSPTVSFGGEFLGNGCGPNNTALGGYGFYASGIFHLGVDMSANTNDNVYAVGNGTIKRISTNFGSDGGAVYVEHTAAGGTKFMAVYGHLKNYKTSGTVEAGEFIGDVNTDHTHFGIHPGAYSSFPSSSLGTLSCSSHWTSGSAPTSTNGFVNPIPYLQSHPVNSSLTNGTFLRASNTNKVYIMAGGAPLYVSNWAHVGGQPPAGSINNSFTQAQIDAMPDYPLDNTFIRDGVTNKVYRIAGGSALYVSDWAHVGGQQSAVKVDGWILTNQLRQYPLDGTFVRDGTTGRVYVVAGGSALYLSDWSFVGGQQATVTIDPWALSNKLLEFPLNGTFIRDGSNSKVYVIAGGAPLYVSDWAHVGGQQSSTRVDPAVLTSKLLTYPVDGTFIRDGTTKKAYVIAGGSALYIDNWAHIGGAKPTTIVDGWVLTNKLLAYPMDGTLIKGYVSQDEYQIVNQQAAYIDNPSQVVGTRTIVDDWALYNQLGIQP